MRLGQITSREHDIDGAVTDGSDGRQIDCGKNWLHAGDGVEIAAAVRRVTPRWIIGRILTRRSLPDFRWDRRTDRDR